ncbi:MAG: hypothetical protein R2694_06690 [Ilumatobacteraceae bacterium]
MRHLAVPLAVAALLLASCSDGSDSAGTSPATAPADPSPTSSAATESTPVAVEPTIESIDVEPNADNVLLATLHVTTDVAARLTISLVEDGAERPVVTTDTVATDHAVPIRGLHADRTQTIRVIPLSADGTLQGAAGTVDITTEPLPFTLPELTVGERVVGEMAPASPCSTPCRRPTSWPPTRGAVSNPPVCSWRWTIAVRSCGTSPTRAPSPTPASCRTAP